MVISSGNFNFLRLEDTADVNYFRECFCSVTDDFSDFLHKVTITLSL